MSEYLKLADDDHTIDVLLEVINAEISVRDMVLRNQYENRMNRDGGNPAFNPVTKERPDKPHGKGRGKGKNGRGGGGGGYAAEVPAPQTQTWQYQSGWEPSAKEKKTEKWKYKRAEKAASATAYAAETDGKPDPSNTKGGGKHGG